MGSVGQMVGRYLWRGKPPPVESRWEAQVNQQAHVKVSLFIDGDGYLMTEGRINS